MIFTTHPLSRIVVLTLCGACLLGALSLSCRPKGSSSGGEQLYATPSDLAPSASPGKEASLILFSTEIHVQINHEVSGNDVTLRLMALDEEIEVEKYRTDGSRFALVQAASERFEPPLPLLEFPVTKDQKLVWKGKLIIGEIGKDSSATTTITKDFLNEKGFSGEAVKSSIELLFDGGGPKESVRELTFWFVPGKGIVKRTFDKGSTRVPPSPPGSAAGKSD